LLTRSTASYRLKAAVAKAQSSFGNNVLNSLKDLWISKSYSDFTIFVNGGRPSASKEFPVHKFALGSQSAVFAAVFVHDMKEKREGKMTIKEFSVKAVEGMLEYMYTGEVQDKNNAMELFAVASKYDVAELKEINEEKMVLCNLVEANALEVFNLGHLYNADKMKSKAFEVIQDMIPKLQLSQHLMDKPKALEGIVKARRECKRKKEMAEKECQEKIKELNKM
jgi:BTB/POZ domain